MGNKPKEELRNAGFRVSTILFQGEADNVECIMSAFANRTVEDETTAIRSWWNRNCKPFSEWFLKLDVDDRLALIRKSCPDIPKLNAQARQAAGETLKATDVLLPELTEDALMRAGGRISLLFITRRCTSICIDVDLKLLRQLENRKNLPIFSMGNSADVIAKLDTPFVDPSDAEEQVRSLNAETTKETRDEVQAGFESGRFASLACWMALKVRRTAIASFMKVLIAEFEEKCNEIWKPNPILEQLIEAELKMQALDADMTESANASSIEGLS